MAWEATPAEEAVCCVQCGHPFEGRATVLTWPGTANLGWAWFLIGVGAVLTVAFGLVAWQADRERSAAEEILPGLPASMIAIEGPSVRRAVLKGGAPPGAVDRYFAAEHRLSRALVDVRFTLAMVGFGIALLARQSVQRQWPGRVSENRETNLRAPIDSTRRRLLEGWSLAETVALSAVRLTTVTFLYVLIARVSTGEPPTWDVAQDTLDRLIQIVTRIPELIR